MNKNYEMNFKEKIKYFNDLGLNLRDNLKKLLLEKNIEFMEVDYRVKTLESFNEKIKRKEYKNPLDEIEDICGVRIICYYINDLKKVDDLIEENFAVLSKSYKEQELEENQFGYRSNHYIVNLKPNWCAVPILKGLDGYKAEIQVRTILMHAWADISHKLNYKKNSKNKEFERKLNQLSALFEIADTHFVNLKEIKRLELQEVIENKKENSFECDLDFLNELASKYFPEKERDFFTSEGEILLESLKKENITPAMLSEYFKKIDREEMKMLEGLVGVGFTTSAVGYIRLVLIVLVDSLFVTWPYFSNITNRSEFLKIKDKYSKI